MQPSRPVALVLAAVLSVPADAAQPTLWYRHVSGPIAPKSETPGASTNNVPHRFALVRPSERIEARVGQFLSAPFHVTGPVDGEPTWSVEGPPPGLSIAGGVLSGIPSREGVYAATVRAVDASGVSASAALTVAVRSSLGIGAVSDIVLQVNESFSIPAPALYGNVGQARWEIVGLVPTGVSISPTDGRLYGSPGFAGDFPIQLRIYDATGTRVDSRQFVMKVMGRLAVSGLANVTAHVGDFVSVPAPQLTTRPSGGVDWTQVKAPPGTAFGATGILSGTLAQPGEHEASVRIADDTGAFTTVTYKVTALPAVTMPEIADQTAYSGVPFSIPAPSVASAVGAVQYQLTGDRPEGVSVDASGRIEGVALVAGTRELTLTATDATGSRASRDFKLVVLPRMSFEAAADVAAEIGQPASFPVPAYRTLPGGHVTWAALAPLPDGLSLAANGTVSGTPAKDGSYQVKLRATDSGSGSATVSYALTVTPQGSLHARAAAPPRVHVGSPIIVPAPEVLSRFTPPLAWQAPTLPAGTTLGGDGSLSGAVAAPGTHPVELSVTDGAGLQGTLSYAVEVVPPLGLPAIADLSADAGVPFSFAAPAPSSAIPPLTWTLSGTLPDGARFDPAYGQIVGTVLGGASSDLTLTAADAAGGAASRAFRLSVRPRLSFAQAQDAVVTVGRAARIAPPAYRTLPVASVTWEARSALPAGMSLQADGSLSGTPSTTGSFPVTLVATDAGSTAATVSYRVIVSPEREHSFAFYPTVTVRRGQPLDLPAPAINSPAAAPVSWLPVTLPQGTSLTAAGRLSGSIAAAGAYQVTVRAVDADFVSGTASYGVNVLSDLALAAVPDRTAQAGSFFIVDPPAVSSSVGRVTWSLSGILPEGANFDAGTGRIGGTVLSASATPLTITATDETGATASRAFRLVVQGRLVLAAAPDASGTVGAYLAVPPPAAVTVPVGTVSWQARSALPAGMSLAEDGTLAGTPSVVGSYPVTILATDSGSTSAVVAYRIYVTPERQLQFSGYSDAVIRVGDPVDVAAPGFSAAPVGAVTWSAVSVPAGTSVGSDGRLAGTVPEAGTYDVTLRAVDAGMATNTVSYKLVVLPEFTLAPVADRTVDAGTAFSLEAPQAFAPYGSVGWSLAGGLPDGVGFEAGSGRIGGTAMAAGSFPLTLSATDALRDVASRSFALVVKARMILRAAADAPATANRQISVAPPAFLSAPAGTVTWSARKALPAGMSLLADGTLAGTPPAQGSFPVELLASDAGSVSQVVAYNLIVGPARQVSLASSPNRTVRRDASVSIPAPGFLNPQPVGAVTWSPVTMPAGLSVGADGAVTGALAAAGTYDVEVRAIDSEFASGTYAYKVTAVPPLEIPSAPDMIADAGIDFDFATPAAANAIGNVTWTSEGVPTGAGFDAARSRLAGRVAAAGTYAITLGAADQAAGVASRRINLVVRPRLALAAAKDVTLRTGSSATVAPPAYASAPGGTVAWRALSALPPGLGHADGTLSGTPTQTGVYPISLEATDPASVKATANYVVTVLGPVSIAAAPAQTLRVMTYPNFAAATVTGTPLSPTWSVEPGSTLPPGLELLPDGRFYGLIGYDTGVFNASVRLTEGGVANAKPLVAGPIRIEVRPALALAAVANARARVGTTYTDLSPAVAAPAVSNQPLPPLAWSNPTNVTVPGLSVSPTTGNVVGSPTQPGTYPIRIAVSDATTGNAQTEAFTLTVSDALRLQGGETTVTAGSDVSIPVTALNAIGTVTWRHTGTLPAGLTAGDATPGVTGKVAADAATGTYVTTFEARDGANGLATATVTVRVLPLVPPGQGFVFESGPAAPALSTETTGYAVASNATGTVEWTLVSGTLPTGITLDYATGKFVGRAQGTANLNGTVTVKVRDGSGIESAPAVVSIGLVAPPTLAASTVSGASGSPSSFSLPTAMSAGNLINATWAVTGGVPLPNGMSLSSDGVLSGTPDAQGATTVTVTATNRSGTAAASASAKLTVNVLQPAPKVTANQSFAFQSGPSAPTLTLQTAGYALASDASGPVTWSVASGTLPAGITLDAQTGRFVGKATGTANLTGGITVTARDGFGSTSQPVSVGIVLVAPPALSAYTLNGASGTAIGTNVSLANLMAATNLVGATWSVTGATPLPTGLQLGANGVISGTPDGGSKAAVTVTVTNAGASPALSSSATLTFNISAPAPTVTAGQSFSFVKDATVASTDAAYAVATSVKGAKTFAIQGTPPAGITFSATTGIFSGRWTGTTNATSTVGVRVTDGTGLASAYENVTIRLVAPPVLLANKTAYGTVNQDISVSLPSLMGGANFANATWANASPLPAGVLLSSGGILSGVPTATGGTTVSITATNPDPALPQTATMNLTVTILDQSVSAASTYPASIEAYDSTMKLVASVPLYACYGTLEKSPGANVPRDGYLVFNFAKPTTTNSVDLVSGGEHGWAGGYMPSYNTIEWWDEPNKQWVNNYWAQKKTLTSTRYRFQNGSPFGPFASMGRCRWGNGGYPPSLN